MPHIQNIVLNISNGKPVTTSRDISTHFEKRHDNVLRNIENLDCSPQFSLLNFEAANYLDEQRKLRKEYQITRNGFMFLVMGFTGKLAGQIKEAYIEAFDKMELDLQQHYQTKLQQGNLEIRTLDDLYNIDNIVEDIDVRVTCTRRGEIIKIRPLKQASNLVTKKEVPTILPKPSWQLIVETFFNEIDSGRIPEKICQNMLLSKELMTATNGQRERHDCLFFRPSNLMAFFLKTPRFCDLMDKSTIQTASLLLAALKTAGVLAFDGKTKEKGIPVNPNLPSDKTVRRVSHLVAIDLMVLERAYGVVLLSSGGIARTFH